jgi:hypothetical protein
MKSVDFPQRNVIVAEHQEQYENLYAHVETRLQETPVTACFELDDDEIEEIVRTRKLWYQCWTFGQPFQPILLSTKNPLPDGGNTETNTQGPQATSSDSGNASEGNEHQD